MDQDYLFVKTLEDIQSTIVKPDGYELLRSTGLIRQLLIDGNRLMDVANRERRIRIRFRIADMWNTAYTKLVLSHNPVFFAALDGLHPLGNLTGDPIIDVTREQFLKHAVALVSDVKVSVYDIVDYGAHIQGGVHIGKNKSNVHEAIDASRSIEVRGFSMTLSQLMPILKVTYDALLPLRMRIKDERGF